MKKKLILLPTVLAATLTSAQTAMQMTAKDKAKIDQLQIEELTRQVDYYKKALKFSTAIRTTKFENLQLTINNVRGIKSDGTIIIEFTYTNLNDKLQESLQFEKAVLVDSQGKQLQTSQVFLSADGKIRVIDLVKGIPYHGVIIFKKNQTYFPIVRALIMYAYPKDQLSNPEPVIFENFPVIWE